MAHRMGRWLLMAMAALAWATAAEAVVATVNLASGERPASGVLKIQEIEDKSQPAQTITVGASGVATADLKPGKTYSVIVDGENMYPRSTQFSIGNDPKTITIQTVTPSAIYGSAPPAGVVNVTLQGQGTRFGDADETRRRVTDNVLVPAVSFVNRADRRTLERLNDGNDNRAGFYFTTVKGVMGLPVPQLTLDCGCTGVSHGIGPMLGYGHVDLDTHSKLDQRQFGTRLTGGGFVAGGSYTAQIWGKPTKEDPWLGWNRLGNRLTLEGMWGHASVDRDPRSQVARFQPPGRLTGDAEDDVHYSLLAVQSDLLYRITDNWFVSAGVRYSRVSYDVNSKNPVNVGFQVDRRLDQSYKADSIEGTLGVEFRVPLGGKAPDLLGRIGGRVGGGGNWGFDARVGVAFDLFSAWR